MKYEKMLAVETQFTYDSWLAAVMNSEFELNEEAVNEFYNNQLNYLTDLAQSYQITLADYVSIQGLTEETLKDQLRQSSVLTLKQLLFAEAIAQKESMELEAVDYENLANEYSTTIDELNTSYGEDYVKFAALILKVTNFIKDNAIVI